MEILRILILAFLVGPNTDPGKMSDFIKNHFGPYFGCGSSNKPIDTNECTFDINNLIKKYRDECSSWPIVFSKLYDISFWKLESLHYFDSKKWGKVAKYLQEKNENMEFVTPDCEIPESILKQYHDTSYLEELKKSSKLADITEIWPLRFVRNSMLQNSLLTPIRYQVMGTVIATCLALFRGWAINIGGGFHHAHRKDGGGFCIYADISIAIETARKLFPEKVEKVMIVDLDAHQGNGHERDFKKDETVFIMDVYNRWMYPHDTFAKMDIECRVELERGTEDAEYLEIVETNLMKSFERFHPSLVFYNAGTDILTNDPLGKLNISEEGVIKRDEIVFTACKERNIPIVMVTSGGYTSQSAIVIGKSIQNLIFKKIIKGPSTQTVKQTEVDYATEGTESTGLKRNEEVPDISDDGEQSILSKQPRMDNDEPQKKSPKL